MATSDLVSVGRFTPAFALLLLWVCTSVARASERSICDQNSLETSLSQLNRLNSDLLQARALTRRDRTLETTVYRAGDLRQRLVRIQSRALRCLESEQASVISEKAATLRPLLEDIERARSQEQGPPIDLPDREVPSSIAALSRGTGNDTCASAPTITLGSYFGSSTGATNDGQATCGASINSPDVWFRYSAPSGGWVYFDTKGSDFDTVASVHSSCSPDSSEKLCSDDGIGLQAAGGFYAHAGEVVWIRLAGYNGATGHYQLTLGEGGSIAGAVSAGAGAWSPSGTVRTVSTEGYQLSSTTIDTDGSYEFSGVPPGDTLLHTQTLDLINEIWDDIPCLPYCQPGDATPIQVGANTAAIADFVLSPGATISGTVLDAETDTPMAGVRVQAHASHNDQASAFTDSDGRYHITGLLGGTYRLLARIEQFVPEYFGGLWCLSGHCRPDSGNTVVVSLDQSRANIDFELDRLGLVSGEVRDEGSDHPLEGVSINIWAFGSRVAFTQTDETGSYSVAAPPGELRVTFYKRGWHAELYDDHPLPYDYYGETIGTAIDHSVGNDSIGINASLASTGRITGTVRGNNTPLGGVHVIAFDPETGLAFSDTTSYGDGAYELALTEAGEYLVFAARHGFVSELYDGVACLYAHYALCPTAGASRLTISADENHSGIDFDLDLPSSIAGRVNDNSGVPLSGVLIEAYAGEVHVRSGTTGANGEYLITNLAAGDYYLRSASTQTLDELWEDIPCEVSCAVSTGAPVSVGVSAQVQGVDFSLARLGSISGSAQGPSGQSAGGTVVLTRADGFQLQSSVDYSTGHYAFHGLTDGSFTIETRVPSDSPFLDETWDDIACIPSCAEVTGTPVVIVGNAQVDGIDFELPRGGSISGLVVSGASGEPTRFAEVEVVDVDGARVRSDYFFGDYTLHGLKPGTYYLAASANDHAAVAFGGATCTPPESLRACARNRSVPITLSLGAEFEANLVLPGLGSISGTAVSPVGAPLAGVAVALYTADDDQIRFTTTGSDGTYQFFELQPGDHYAVTLANQGFLNESYDNIPCPVGPPHGCDPSKGTAITVEPNRETRHVRFELEPTTGSAYGVIRSRDGEVILGAIVDVWRANGTHYESRFVDGAGTFSLDLPSGTYYLTTDAGPGFLNEVWQGITCPGGPAYSGSCDPTSGTPITISSSQPPQPVAFYLEVLVETVFADSFESGDSSAWSP